MCVTLITAVRSTTPTLTHVIPSPARGTTTVTAVTSLGDDVFVARVCSQQVAVYNAVTLTLRRHLTVPVIRAWLSPSSLAVTKNDAILVADKDNRILSISSSLGSIQELALSVDGGIHWPLGLCLDESRGRLYVGEWGGECRVLVFDHIY